MPVLRPLLCHRLRRHSISHHSITPLARVWTHAIGRPNRGPYRGVAALLALVSCLVVGCTPLPQTRPTRGLYVDLRKAVELQEQSDWVVDRLEVEDALEGVMASVCASTRDAREDLRSWLNDRIDAEAGHGASEQSSPSEVLYRRDGKMSSRAEDVRTLERVRLMLDGAEDVARECPYWLDQETDFAGNESDERRFVVLAESIGAAALRVADGEIGVGGGGGGRVLLGYGVSARLTLALGIEVGASGTLPETDEGTRTFEAVASSAVPLLLRISDVSRHFDVELAWSTLYTEGATRHGLRVGLGYGLSTPRVASFMPYALLWVGYEVFAPSSSSSSSSSAPRSRTDAVEHGILLGTRVGVNWDP